MTIHQIEYFAAVCRFQNITRAAQELHISQSTLSLSMKELERETGLNLFRHVGRNIEITAEGAALAGKAEAMLAAYGRFSAGVAELAHRHLHLRLAVPPQIGTYLLPKLLGGFHALHPEIPLEICEPPGVTALDLVEREEVDLAIVNDKDERTGLEAHRLWERPVCLCVPEGNPLAEERMVTLAQVASMPLVMLNQKFHSTAKVLGLLEERGFSADVLLFTPHLATVWNLVLHGLAAGILLEGVVLPQMPLRLIPIEGIVQQAYIFTKAGRQIYADERTLMRYIRGLAAKEGGPARRRPIS